MIYGFATEDESAATGALLFYAIYRSRNIDRYRGDTRDYWGQIERFIKAAAKRSLTLGQFLEKLKPRLSCGSIRPKWMEIGHQHNIVMIERRDEQGRLMAAIQPSQPERREFLTHLFNRADHAAVLEILYGETAWIVLLVRDRLEREKPIEATLVEAEVSDEPEDPDLLYIQGVVAQ